MFSVLSTCNTSLENELVFYPSSRERSNSSAVTGAALTSDHHDEQLRPNCWEGPSFTSPLEATSTFLAGYFLLRRFPRIFAPWRMVVTFWSTAIVAGSVSESVWVFCRPAGSGPRDGRRNVGGRKLRCGARIAHRQKPPNSSNQCVLIIGGA